MKNTILKFPALFLFFSLVFNGCDPKANNQTDSSQQEQNPIPVISSILPESHLSRLSAFTLTVKGRDFVNGSTIVFDGSEKITRFISQTELSCQIEADDTQLSAISSLSASLQQNAGSNAISPVLVRNPGPGGGDSNIMEFAIKTNYNFEKHRILFDSDLDESIYLAVSSDEKGNLYAAFIDGEYNTKHVRFLRSTDGGKNWSKDERITGFEHGMSEVQIKAKKDGDLYILWNLYFCNSNGSACYRKTQFKRSWDGGKTWTKTRDAQIAVRHVSGIRTVVNDEGFVYVVFGDSMNDHGIYFMKSEKHGDGWTQPKKIYVHRKPKRSNGGFIAADNQGNVYIVIKHYQSDEGLSFMRSTDRGDNWTTPVSISESDEYVRPDIVCDQKGNVYIVTARRGRPLIFTSGNFGETWSGEMRMSGKVDKISSVGIALDQMGNLNATWCFELDTGFCYARSTDHGLTWSETRNIFENPITCNNWISTGCQPYIGPEGKMHVFWRQRDRKGTKPIDPFRSHFTSSE